MDARTAYQHEVRHLVDDARAELDALYWRWRNGERISGELADICKLIHAVAAARVPPHEPEPH